MTSREVILDGGSPWGFRMHGGADVNQPLKISRVNPGSKAALKGIREGDLITSINGQSTKTITNGEAHALLKTAGDTVRIGLNEDNIGASSPKRRQYKTVHQESHSETVKRSTVTTYSVKKSYDSEESYQNDVIRRNGNDTVQNNGKGNNDIENRNDQSKTQINNNIASQRSTLSSSSSSNLSIAEAGSLKSSSPDNGTATERSISSNPTSPSSILTELGIGGGEIGNPHYHTGNQANETNNIMMADNPASHNKISRSRRRRARRKALKLSATTSSQLTTNEQTTTKYRVDSPEKEILIRTKSPSAPITKSRSLDDDDLVKIQEISDCDDKIQQNENPIVSEASESEVEWEEATTLDTLSLPLEDPPLETQTTLISPEEELTLRNFLETLNLVNSPEEAIKRTYEHSTPESIKARRAKKRAALEQYFLPMVQNPRYLDVISEETSDLSDREQPSLTRHLKQGTPELDLDDAKPPAVPVRRKKGNRIKLESPGVRQEAIRVDAKIFDSAPVVAEGVCSTSVAEIPIDSAEIVFLEDSSSSSGSEHYEECEENESVTEQVDSKEEIQLDLVKINDPKLFGIDVNILVEDCSDNKDNISFDNDDNDRDAKKDHRSPIEVTKIDEINKTNLVEDSNENKVKIDSSDCRTNQESVIEDEKITIHKRNFDEIKESLIEEIVLNSCGNKSEIDISNQEIAIPESQIDTATKLELFEIDQNKEKFKFEGPKSNNPTNRESQIEIKGKEEITKPDDYLNENKGKNSFGTSQISNKSNEEVEISTRKKEEIILKPTEPCRVYQNQKKEDVEDKVLKSREIFIPIVLEPNQNNPHNKNLRSESNFFSSKYNFEDRRITNPMRQFQKSKSFDEQNKKYEIFVPKFTKSRFSNQKSKSLDESKSKEIIVPIVLSEEKEECGKRREIDSSSKLSKEFIVPIEIKENQSSIPVNLMNKEQPTVDSKEFIVPINLQEEKSKEFVIPIEISGKADSNIKKKSLIPVRNNKEFIVPIELPQNSSNSKELRVPIDLVSESSKLTEKQNSKEKSPKEIIVPIVLLEETNQTKSNPNEVIIPIVLTDQKSNFTEAVKTTSNSKKDITTENNSESINKYLATELTPPPTPDSVLSGNEDDSLDLEVSNATMSLIQPETLYCNVVTPPAPSRSQSSSSGSSSFSTAKLNPNCSIADMSSISKDIELVKELLTLFEPKSLREICLNYLMTLPFGVEVLQELADVSLSIDNLTNRLPSELLPKIAPKLPAFFSSTTTNDDSNKINDLPVDAMKSIDKWIGLPMKQDPNFLVCLSPKQKQLLDETKSIPNEAEKLLELHEKFLERSMYNKQENSVCTGNKSGCNKLLAIIQEEPKLSNPGNSSTIPRYHDTARLKTTNLNEWLQLARHKSTSEPSNLNRIRRRFSMPQELFERQLHYLQEQERKIQHELDRLEDEKRKLTSHIEMKEVPKQFEPDDYHISRRGDYAVHTKERPQSMPTEFFRQKMYEEYLDQMAERVERRQNKVIKLSTTVGSEENTSPPSTISKFTQSEIEEEFMKKVREKQRQGKLEDTSNNNNNNKNSEVVHRVLVVDGDSVSKGAPQALPKHLQEFMDMKEESNDDGIWSPGQKQDHKRPQELIKEVSESSKEKDEADTTTVIPVWTPKSANSSPTSERKEFRPVNFQSPVLSRKNKQPQTPSSQNSETDIINAEPPWKLQEASGIIEKRLTTSQSSPASGFIDIPSSRLPKAQNPTITLLQKAREGQLPKGAHYLDQNQSSSGQFPRRPQHDRSGIIGPGEIVYKIKNEYTSESDSGERSRKMADLGPRKFEGIGPTTRNGMPLTLRSEVQENNQSKWYKKMYDTIHKQKPHGNEYVTVRYKQRRAQYPYTSGYLSEPEPGAYDSDFAEFKYTTLDRRRSPDRTNNFYTTSTMPRPISSKSSSDIVRNSQGIYRNQPGRIENYQPGHSSISDKEAKEWWDEVMDIFDGWLDDNSPVPSYDYLFAKALARSHLEQQKRVPQTRSFINQALKESGYESDSTLVFRRKEETNQQQLSPSEQKEAYKVIQKGGDVPLHGLRKPAPERPKDQFREEHFEYFPLSPTLTRIRVHKNIKPQTEIFCYPVTVHYDKFGDHKRGAPSSIVVPPPSPPSPPRRKSSRNNSTLRLISTMKVTSEKSPLCKRHETCFTTTSNIDKTKVKYLRDKLTCKLSPSPTRKRFDNPKLKISKTITTTPDLKSRITSTVTTSKDSNKVLSRTKIKPLEKCCLTRSKSAEPPRSICKTCSAHLSKSKSSSKTFGTEKAKVDLVLPKSSSKKIVRSPDLLSPNEVKKAQNGVVYKKSTAILSSSKQGSTVRSLPIKVGTSEKGRSIIKPSLQSSKTKNLSASKSSLESLSSLRSTRKQSTGTTSKSKPKSEKTANKPKPKKDSVGDVIVKTKKKEFGENSTTEKQKDVNFFQNLLLRDISPTPSTASRNSWLLEKTSQLTRRRPSILEPSIGAMKVYLKHTKPVSDSKFRSLDIAIRSRSASPKTVTWQGGVSNTKRSSSLPAKLIFSQTSRPISPVVPLSPVRSPSTRRIMQFRNQSNENLTTNLRRKAPPPLSIYMCPSLNQSTSSIESFENNEYQAYLKDLVQSRRSSKFQDLNHFYSDIEKLGQLEQTFNVKPRKRSESEIVDYDRWQEVRLRERAENELAHLYSQLRENEKEKGFLFKSTNLNRYRWNKELDRGLRIKEKSVENIKEAFEKLKLEESERENARRRELAYSKDTYKPLWRGNSVVNLANLITERRTQSEDRKSRKFNLNPSTEKLLNHGIGSRIWSSLSMEQVNLLKEQLSEIYNQNSTIIQVPKDKNDNYINPLTVRRNSDTTPHVYKEKNPTSLSSTCLSTNLTEDDKKVLSQSLSKEVLNKMMMKKRDVVVPKEVLGAVAAADASLKLPKKPLIKTNALTNQIQNKHSSTSETESGSTDESTKTVIYQGTKEDIKKKVEYFEKASEEPVYTPTIYKPADDHQPDEGSTKIEKSESCQNLKEYFGESDLKKFATIPLSASRKDNYIYPIKPQFRALSPVKTISEATSFDSLCRSRSLSPYFDQNQSEVQKLRSKFEYLDSWSLRRSHSDSDLRQGYVDEMRRKYEYPVLSGRGRSRTRRGGVVSPMFLRAEDRFMPHINIISKIARLYHKKPPTKQFNSIEELATFLGCPVGEVEKLKEKFENTKQISLAGQMFTSSPNIKELRDIAPYLTASWIAHRYPRSEDNSRSLLSPECSVGGRDTSRMRKDRSKLKDGDHSGAVRYKSWSSATYARPSVSFKDPGPPTPPPKSQHTLRNLPPQESPRKYVENQVTIHYKTPVRQEIKECLSEDELAYRQAEAMKKIYQEERRRKYLQVSKSLQELQDMNSRRHTDNFIPSQKSPIPLNRYDDFEVVAPPPSIAKPPPRSPEPRLVARALYNFVGQSARELTFRKGDLIYVRRQVDKNWYEGELNAMVGLFPVNYVEIIHTDTIRSTIPTQRKSYEGQARAKYNFIAQTHLELSLAKGELVVITRKVDDNWFEGKIGGRKGIFPISYVDVLIDPQEPPVPTTNTKPVASPAAHSLLHNGSAGGKDSMGSHLYTPSLPNPQLATSYHAKPVHLTGNGTYGSLGRSLKSPIDQTLHIETQSEPVPYRALYKYTPQNDDELELMEGDLVFVLEKCDDGWYVGSSDRTGAFGTFPGNYVEKI